MWSKQADTATSAASTRDNKNMTSFRNKITNRKRKNSKSRNSTTTDSALNSEKNSKAVDDDLNLTSKHKQKDDAVDKKHQSKNNKNRGRNRCKKDTNNTAANKKLVAVDTVRIINKETSNKIVNDISDNEIDVVLRHSLKDDVITQKNVNNNSTTAKRYSDSFVVENEIGQMKIKEENQTSIPPALTRAVSGFFIIDHARKANRRLSDLFRTSSTLKLSTSVENLKSVEEKNKIILEKGSLNKNPESNTKKSNKISLNNKTDSFSMKTKKNISSTTPKLHTSTKGLIKKDSISSTKDSNSYLRRVKSKIYKSKSEPVDEIDNAVDSKSRKLKPKKSIENNGRIPEETEAVLTPNGLRKSLTHFDFRLPRQSSNLERVRPKTYSAKKSDEESEKENIIGKPVMEKAKSSSAINLSLWKSRRNKIVEQMASKATGLSCSSQDVQNEFDFIAFGSVNNIARSGGFGSQNSLQKQPSWLHIHKNFAEGNSDDYFIFIYFFICHFYCPSPMHIIVMFNYKYYG